MAHEDLSTMSLAERLALVGRDDLDPTTQDLLAGDDAWTVRNELAMSPVLAASAAALLLAQGDESTLLRLAWNKASTPRTQLELVRNGRERVRFELASRPGLAPEVQALLVEDADVRVRWALSCNTSLLLEDTLPVALLELSERGQTFVSDEASKGGVEPEVLSTLRRSWTGTLKELVETAKELGSETT